MAGHSKWANIKHRKSAVDAKKGRIFSRIGKEILMAVKNGGADENTNLRLRAAISKAKIANMPKDNIDRVIKKGSGELGSETIEEILYEGYAPGGVAVLVEVVTDKKSRTLPEIKSLFSKSGGSLAEEGSVSFQFDYKGIILIEKNTKDVNYDILFDFIIDAGAEDLNNEDSIYIVKTTKEAFHHVLHKLELFVQQQGWEIIESSLQYLPQNYITLTGAEYTTVESFLENLENHDDVQNVYSNLE